ncbi:DNA-binding protein [Methylobacterium organophilum]|jgi:hypothetical protein|uniref:DNA-binding protein n=1 Tax=Methylobacterium organophilum TaxID=410 RepID=UPI0019D291A7|nr:DNA-binding protein [Methylobacterium organophilum]MBN6820703.1 DNA-binding protein [Methylobacterium organophilum]
MTSHHAPPLQGEMLYGTKAIAEFLGIRPRQALHLLEQDRLPHFHVGRVLCANRSTLRQWLADQEAMARKAG